MLTNELMGALITKGISGVVQALGWCSGTMDRIPWNAEEFAEFESEALEYGSDIDSFYKTFGSNVGEHARKFPQEEEER